MADGSFNSSMTRFKQVKSLICSGPTEAFGRLVGELMFTSVWEGDRTGNAVNAGMIAGSGVKRATSGAW